MKWRERVNPTQWAGQHQKGRLEQGGVVFASMTWSTKEGTSTKNTPGTFETYK